MRDQKVEDKDDRDYFLHMVVKLHKNTYLLAIVQVAKATDITGFVLRVTGDLHSSHFIHVSVHRHQLIFRNLN